MLTIYHMATITLVVTEMR